jgi:hypothetical protein
VACQQHLWLCCLLRLVDVSALFCCCYCYLYNNQVSVLAAHLRPPPLGSHFRKCALACSAHALVAYGAAFGHACSEPSCCLAIVLRVAATESSYRAIGDRIAIRTVHKSEAIDCMAFSDSRCWLPLMHGAMHTCSMKDLFGQATGCLRCTSVIASYNDRCSMRITAAMTIAALRLTPDRLCSNQSACCARLYSQSTAKCCLTRTSVLTPHAVDQQQASFGSNRKCHPEPIEYLGVLYRPMQHAAE